MKLLSRSSNHHHHHHRHHHHLVYHHVDDYNNEDNSNNASVKLNTATMTISASTAVSTITTTISNIATTANTSIDMKTILDDDDTDDEESNYRQHDHRHNQPHFSSNNDANILDNDLIYHRSDDEHNNSGYTILSSKSSMRIMKMNKDIIIIENNNDNNKTIINNGSCINDDGCCNGGGGGSTTDDAGKRQQIFQDKTTNNNRQKKKQTKICNNKINHIDSLKLNTKTNKVDEVKRPTWLKSLLSTDSEDKSDLQLQINNNSNKSINSDHQNNNLNILNCKKHHSEEKNCMLKTNSTPNLLKLNLKSNLNDNLDNPILKQQLATNTPLSSIEYKSSQQQKSPPIACTALIFNQKQLNKINNLSTTMVKSMPFITTTNMKMTTNNNNSAQTVIINNGNGINKLFEQHHPNHQNHQQQSDNELSIMTTPTKNVNITGKESNNMNLTSRKLFRNNNYNYNHAQQQQLGASLKNIVQQYHQMPLPVNTSSNIMDIKDDQQHGSINNSKIITITGNDNNGHNYRNVDYRNGGHRGQHFDHKHHNNYNNNYYPTSHHKKNVLSFNANTCNSSSTTTNTITSMINTNFTPPLLSSLSSNSLRRNREQRRQRNNKLKHSTQSNHNRITNRCKESSDKCNLLDNCDKNQKGDIKSHVPAVLPQVEYLETNDNEAKKSMVTKSTSREMKNLNNDNNNVEDEDGDDEDGNDDEEIYNTTNESRNLKLYEHFSFDDDDDIYIEDDNYEYDDDDNNAIVSFSSDKLINKTPKKKSNSNNINKSNQLQQQNELSNGHNSMSNANNDGTKRSPILLCPVGCIITSSVTATSATITTNTLATNIQTVQLPSLLLSASSLSLSLQQPLAAIPSSTSLSYLPFDQPLFSTNLLPVQSSTATAGSETINNMNERLRQQKWLDTTMSNMLLKTYTYLRQPKILLDYKRALQNSITQCLAMIMEEKFKIFLIGSSLTSLGSNRSDIDLCMVIYDRRGQVDERYQNRVFAEYTLGRIRNILERFGLAFECKVIRANVPILKFYDHNHVEVNLNLNKLVTVQNTLLLMHCCSLDSRVAPFLFTVKLWAQKNGINCAYFKSLSSYALSLMSIFFLQNVCQPPILPSFDHILDLIKASTKLFSHFHSNSYVNKMKNAQQNFVLRQLCVTTSADYYHLKNQNQFNGLVLPPPPIISNVIPRNISRVSLVPNYIPNNGHNVHIHHKDNCFKSQTSSQSSVLCSSSTSSSTCSLNSNSSLDNSITGQVILNPGNHFRSRQLSPTSSPTTAAIGTNICNLHFSQNVPAAIAMTFAAQRLNSSTVSTISTLTSTNTSATSTTNTITDKITTTNIENSNFKSNEKEINRYRKVQQSTLLGNHYPTAVLQQQQNKSPTQTLSSSPLHMNYFSFYYYYFSHSQQPQKTSQYLTSSHNNNRCSLSDGSSSDDLDLIDQEEFLSQLRSSPTTSPTLTSSTSSSSDSGFYYQHTHHHHHNHLQHNHHNQNHNQQHQHYQSNISFDRALYDRLSLLNLSPPLTPSDNQPKSTATTVLNSLKSDFSSSDESLTFGCCNNSDYEYDLLIKDQYYDLVDPYHHNYCCKTSGTSSPGNGITFKSPNEQSMGSLFAQFIDYYANPAIYDHVISVRTGSLMKRTDPVFARSSYTSMDTFICVEEPFNHTNTSHSVHNDFMFNFILKSFKWTKELLQKMKMNRDDFI